jgi:GH25 family lysozyme M1 (1,4-beta-N-acetylmuramidase)
LLLIKNAALQRSAEAVQSELDALNNQGYYTVQETQALMQEAANKAAADEAQATRDMMQQKLENGDGTIAAIRSLFPDNMVVASGGRYHFFPILDEVEKHGFEADDFEIDDDGFMKYIGDVSSVKVKNGIDVSRFQGQIDWEKVKAAGVDFAFIRAGLRGTTEGKILVDDYFEYNMKNATENGIEVGVYFYSQATNEEEALEEVQLVLDLIEPYDVSFPVVIDIESSDSDNARTADMTSDEYELVAKTFCDTVAKAGYKPMIYGNIKSFTILMDIQDIADYGIWVAYYGTPLYYPYHFDVWQYSSTGSIDGIDGNVDLNICVTK